jgi:hypothetical protein
MSDRPVLDYARPGQPEQVVVKWATRPSSDRGWPHLPGDAPPDPRRYRQDAPGPVGVALFVAAVVLAALVLVVGVAVKVIWTQVLQN